MFPRSADESPGPGKRWTRARFGVEAAPVSARHPRVLSSRQWRHCQRRRMPARRLEESGGASAHRQRHPARPHRGRPGAAAQPRCGGRVSPPRLSHLRTHRCRRPFGIKQGLLQGVHAAPQHSHREVRGLRLRGRSSGSARADFPSHRGEGGRAGCGQGRGHLSHQRRSCQGRRRHAQRQNARGRGQARGVGRVSRGRGNFLHGGERWRARDSAGGRPGFQTRGRWRHRSQHRRHGLLFRRSSCSMARCRSGCSLTSPAR